MAHPMRNLPSMMVLAERSAHHNVRLSTQCLPCDSYPEAACHLGNAQSTPVSGAQPTNTYTCM